MQTITINPNNNLGIGTGANSFHFNQVYTPTFSIPEGTITFGDYTFHVDQLGELLSKLLLQYPELCV